MKLWIKAALCISLSFMCLFCCIGYASFSTEMSIEGSAEVSPPNALFIYSISNVRTNNASVKVSPWNPDFPSTKVLSEIVFAKNKGSVSFDVLVVNGTEFDRYFDVVKEFEEMEGIEGSFSYANVTATASPGQGTLVGPGEAVTFTVTLTYTGTQTNQTRRMLHELRFVMTSDDMTEAVSFGVTDQFKKIINGELEEDISYTYNGSNTTVKREEAYDKIMDQMHWSSSGSFVGNLEGSDEDEKALLTALFEGELTFKVGSEEVPVTIMIKEKDVYGSGDDELVLFITADDLDKREDVPIYAAIFTKENGKWIQVGDILQGEAPVTGYSGLSTLWGTGSFNTEKWVSTESYYGVAAGKDIEDVMNGYEKQNP